MLRLVITNQRGGDTKTTTTTTLARYFADQGRRVLIIDTDPQGSVSVILGMKAGDKNLHNFLVKNHNFEDCLVSPHPNIDVLNSSRDTVATEATLMGQTARELTFRNVFPNHDSKYEVVLIDVAPSISLLQTCAMIYAQQFIIPVSMDPLSLQGAAASIETARTLTRLFNIIITPVAILPVKVDRRYQITTTILRSLDEIAKRNDIPILPVIRTDAVPTKASRAKKFLADFDPTCRAMEDYAVAFGALADLVQNQLGLIEGQHVEAVSQV